MRGVNADGRRYTEFIDALRREALVVVQKDKERENDREPLARAGYVGVFRFKDLEIGNDNSVKLTLIQRYADPSRP